MDTIAKYLSRWYPVPGIVWARYAAQPGDPARLPRRARRAAAACAPRGPACSSRAACCSPARRFLYFTSLSVLPLADAAAIGFVHAAVRRRCSRCRCWASGWTWRALVAILVGLAGALIIVRPGLRACSRPTRCCRSAWRCATRSTRSSRARSRASSIRSPRSSGARSSARCCCRWSAPFVWVTPQAAWHWALLGVIGVLASIGHFLLIRAYDYASATLLAPFTYTHARLGDAARLAACSATFPTAGRWSAWRIIVFSGLFLGRPPAPHRAPRLISIPPCRRPPERRSAARKRRIERVEGMRIPRQCAATLLRIRRRIPYAASDGLGQHHLVSSGRDRQLFPTSVPPRGIRRGITITPGTRLMRRRKSPRRPSPGRSSLRHAAAPNIAVVRRNGSASTTGSP